MHTEGIEALLMKGDWEGAEYASKAALQVCPTNPKFHGYLGVSLFRRSKFEMAADSFKRATLLDPRFCDAGAKLAQCYDRLHRYEEAYEVAVEWLKISPSNKTLQGLARALELQVRGNRTDGWERTAHLGHHVILARDE